MALLNFGKLRAKEDASNVRNNWYCKRVLSISASYHYGDYNKDRFVRSTYKSSAASDTDKFTSGAYAIASHYTILELALALITEHSF